MLIFKGKDMKGNSRVSESIFIIQAWFLLVFMDFRLRFFPVSRNTRLLQAGKIDSPIKKRHVMMYDIDPTIVINQFSSMIQRAGRYHFFFNTSCLRRSLVLRKLLHQAGIEAKLMYGLSLNTKGTGHAWLEVVSPQSVKGQKIDTLSNPDNFIPLGKGGPVDGN